ncbi:hypothetical protein, partial [Lactobacillus delbrueckii]|uniref:hypothetical protein n=1 Tax=Lactobacillus delbrueckii TaxID=1584 RepID=UPI001BB0E5F9
DLFFLVNRGLGANNLSPLEGDENEIEDLNLVIHHVVANNLSPLEGDENSPFLRLHVLFNLG